MGWSKIYREEIIMYKICTKCKQEKSLSLFRSRGGKLKHLLKSSCNTCMFKAHRSWTENNPDRVKEYRQKDSWTLAKRCARRGITPEEFVIMYEQQNECCAICKMQMEIMDNAIDHNHATGQFRGILCKQCNRALGMFRDSPKILKSAVKYLEAFGTYSKFED